MKKIITTLLLLCVAIHTIDAFNIQNCMKEIMPNNLNSKNLLDFIQENNLHDKVMQICSSDICSNINIANLERDIKDFINRNLNYLKNKDGEQSLEAELKGFRIDKIFINSCE